MAGAAPSRPLISLIAALADDRVIGIGNRLPWKLPADMRWFRACTMGKPIVMGRKTFESFGGRVLPGRTNIIVTRDTAYAAEGAAVVHSVDEALAAAGPVDEVMVIGGAELYAQTLPRADRLYLTWVHGRFEGDAWFPEVDFSAWRELERHDHAADPDNPCAYSFVIYTQAAESSK